MSIPLAGALAKASDWSNAFPTNTDAWPSWAAVLTQSGTVTSVISTAKYIKIGRLVVAVYFLTATGAGTASNVVTVSLPVAASTTGLVGGSAFIYDASAGTIFGGSTTLASTTTAAIMLSGGNGNLAGATGSGFTAALANTDQVRGICVYESAS